MVSIKSHQRSVIAHIAGDIDHHSAETLRRTIDGAYARASAKNIVIDFANVTFMDSSGIGMIIGRYKNVKKQGGQLFAANVGPDIGRIFTLSGLPKIIQTFDGVAQALDAMTIK